MDGTVGGVEQRIKKSFTKARCTIHGKEERSIDRLVEILRQTFLPFVPVIYLTACADRACSHGLRRVLADLKGTFSRDGRSLLR